MRTSDLITSEASLLGNYCLNEDEYIIEYIEGFTSRDLQLHN